MQFPSASLLNNEGQSPELGHLCEEMFIAGARALGFDLNEEMPAGAQIKIIEAGVVLVETLREILRMTVTSGRVQELGN